MDSRRRKKKKQIMMQKRTLDVFMRLPKHKRLLRYLKEKGLFHLFIEKVMFKHKVSFGRALNMIKSNPDINNLIGLYAARNYQWYWSYELDDFTKNLEKDFEKYNPMDFNNY